MLELRSQFIIFQKSDLSTAFNIDKFSETNNVRVRQSVQENLFATRSQHIHGNDLCKYESMLRKHFFCVSYRNICPHIGMGRVLRTTVDYSGVNDN